MNETVGGEAARCSPGRRCGGRVAWDLQRMLRALRGAELPVGAGPDGRNTPLPQEQSGGG